MHLSNTGVTTNLQDCRMSFLNQDNMGKHEAKENHEPNEPKSKTGFK